MNIISLPINFHPMLLSRSANLRSLLAALALLLATAAQAQRIDTIAVPSPSMHKNIPAIVILPDSYAQADTLPAVYLLHGHGNNQGGWLQIRPDLPQIASRLGMIFVCPDAATSWYWDSPRDSTLRYETFVSSELPAYIDANYKTRPNASGRAITGYSMGGQGGLWLGIRHPDVFGACGSTSGGVDIRPFPTSWHMAQNLGPLSQYPDDWEQHTIASQLHKVNPGYPIIIDCGTSDFFFPVNERLHNELLYRNIRHEYITRPGSHNRTYWSISIEPQLLFFSRFFRGEKVYP